MQLPNARPMDAENEKPAGASGDGGVAGDEDDRQVDELDSGDEEEDDEEEDEDEDEVDNHNYIMMLIAATWEKVICLVVSVQ